MNTMRMVLPLTTCRLGMDLHLLGLVFGHVHDEVFAA